MSGRLSEKVHIVKGIDPVADAFAGTVTTDVVSMANYNRCTFEIIKGVGTTGTSTITVQASAANDGASPTAVPFTYRRLCNTGDVVGAITAATAAGFDTTAGSSERYVIEVDAAALPAGKPWVHLKAVEVANDPVLGGVEIFLSEPRSGGASLASAI